MIVHRSGKWGRRSPVSNIERQRQFRLRNPGYYGRLHRRRKQQAEIFAFAKQAALAAGLAESAAFAVACRVSFAKVNLLLAIAEKRPLMLPAPVVVMTIPGLNAIGSRVEAERSAAILRENSAGE